MPATCRSLPSRPTPLGQYGFIGIEAGTYFVKVSLPTELQFKPGTDTQKVVISLAEAEGVVGPKIDDFETTQIVTASPPLPASQNSTQLDSGVLGGERDMYVELTKGNDPFSSVSLTSGVRFVAASKRLDRHRQRQDRLGRCRWQCPECERYGLGWRSTSPSSMATR